MLRVRPAHAFRDHNREDLIMRKHLLVLTLVSLLSGCTLFEPPVQSGNGATLPTGTYDTAAEKWADESSAARRKAERERTEKVLEKVGRQ